jgi:TolA-binding protein
MSFRSPAHLRLLRLAPLLGLLLIGTAPAQPAAEQQAETLLAGAKRAYAERNYPFAAARFREYLTRYASQPGAATARYGLAVCLLDGPERNADAALVELAKLLPQKSFADHPFVLYYAGLARRTQGDKSADANVARRRFEEAAAHFRDASAAFFERVKDEKKPSEDRERALRARCDRAEMLLRLGRAKEAREAIAISDPVWQKSRSLPLGHYLHGFASFLLGDHFAAGKSLSLTSVLTDEVFGTHARYLLGRVHHLNTKQDEREEARLAYQAVLHDHDAARKSAQATLNQPADPETKARRERLVKGPLPDHVARARFFLGVLQHEDGRFAEALEHFRTFVAQRPPAGFVPEAALRMGLCQAQLKQPDAALQTLQPLAEKEPALAAQALHGIARARLAKADPKRRETYRPAVEALQKAARQPGARRGEVLADLVEAHQLAGQYKEAVAACASLLDEKLLPAREEEMTLALATLQQLAGDFEASEKTCARFLERFKGSPLTPAVLFRSAENAALGGRAGGGFEAEAGRRYAALVERYPDSPHAHLARQGLGVAYFRKGDLEKAQKSFEAIPASDRTGELAGVAYYLADIYLRQLPARADDAVSAGKMEEKLRSAAEALEAFLTAAPNGPQVPDALLKLGFCQQRMAKLFAQPAERQNALMAARAAYERIRDRHRGHPTYPQAMFERAKVLASLRGLQRGINELKVFTTDATLRKSSPTPLALLYLATLQRRLNRAADAVSTLAGCRKTYEDSLSRDPARSSWVPLLRYHHAAALREAGKLPEAQALFELVARVDRPEGWDASLRAGQCRRDLASKTTLNAETAGELRDAAASFAAREQALRTRKPATEEAQKALAQVRGRLLYESAQAWRVVAEAEVTAARRKLQAERGKKAGGEKAWQEIPRQPAEARVRSAYEKLIKGFPDHALHADARLELAEVLAQRHENDEAIQALQGALEGEKEPPPELTDRIKLQLAACLLDRGIRKLPAEAGKKDVEAALEQLQPLTANARSPVFAQASYREAECHLHSGKLDDAVKLLSRFRDHGPLQRVAGVSDRALLRLGWALGEKKQWELSRQAYEHLLGRFAASPWRHEARFGLGLAQQNLGRFDEAAGSYAQVAGALGGRLGARAQFSLGTCRMLQKRYKDASVAFQGVPAKSDDPGLSARALLEAARALQEDKQREQAVRLLRQVLRDHEGSEHAESARKRLKELGES